MTIGISVDQETCRILGQAVYSMEEKPPDGYMWSRERLAKLQATSRPDYLWPELCTKLGRNAKLKEKHKWAIEKPKLDSARR